MLKQHVPEQASPAPLTTLVALVLQHLNITRQRFAYLEVFRLSTGSDFPGLTAIAPRYIIDIGTHMTPTFSVTGDGVVIEHSDDVGAMSSMNIEDAARLLAGELAEVA